MIDFYKYSFLSILGKNARVMSEVTYLKEIVYNYDTYLKNVKKLKEKKEQDGEDNNTEIYL